MAQSLSRLTQLPNLSNNQKASTSVGAFFINIFFIICNNECMKHIQPYSDDKMLYNEETKQYELKASWVKANFGNPYSDDNTLTVRIKRNTRKVYNYIFSHGYSGNRRAILAIINHTEEYRNYIFDALSSQMEADLASGYNDQDLYLAKNMDERNMQLVNQVTAQTETILKSADGYGGINLLFASTFNYGVYLEFWSEIQ